jgi:alpha-L-fucosidase
MRKLRADILERRPDIVINGRMLGYGDYVTPEQAAPMTAPDGPWELCLTLNDSWGYRPADQNFKSVRQLVRYFTETIGMGGNLLLGIGPTQDGVVPPESAARLEELGRWISRHAEAVYPTGRGLPAGHCYGPSAISADRTVLYLFCLDPPREFVAVRGIKTPVRSVSVLGAGAKLAHRVVGGLHEIPGVLHIAAPQEADIDEYATVLAVELESELELSRDRVRDWTRTPAGRRRLNIASRWSLPGLA